MRRLAFAVVSAVGGYALGAALGYLLVTGLSGNAHDRSVEAAMTGAFVTGPLAAVVAAVAGAVWGGRARGPAARG